MAGLESSVRFTCATRWKCQCKLGVSWDTLTTDSLPSNGIHQDSHKERRRAHFSNSYYAWDNRLDQGSRRHLDLEHKNTSQAVWLNNFRKEKCVSLTHLGGAQGFCFLRLTYLLGYGVEVSSHVISTGSGSPKRRPSVPDLRQNFEVLRRELSNFIAEHGRPGLMPMRYELRKHGRVDLEKAIARMGGSAKVAERMELSLAYKQRKPRGYWDELENLSREILLFQDENGMDSKIMPTRRSFEKAGRYDLARAFEKWGGLREVANHLGLHVRWAKARLKQQQLPLDVSGQAVANSSSNDITEPFFTLPMKTALPSTSTKWLTIQTD